MDKELVLVDLDQVLDILRGLKEDDIEAYGIETMETFDYERAEIALESGVTIYEDYIVEPVRCKKCRYKLQCFNDDINQKGKGLATYDCEKRRGGYLGDDGYCSEGELEV